MSRSRLIIRADDFMLGGHEIDKALRLGTVSVSDLPLTTVRISCDIARDKIRRATGFFFEVASPSGQEQFIITTKHTFETARHCTLDLSIADEKGEQIKRTVKPVFVPAVDKKIIEHPNPGIDLCALPLAPILADHLDKDRPFFSPLRTEAVIASSEVESLAAIEEVVLVGYPAGLWDSANNRPIIRRGITATPLNLDFDGKPQFLVDSAVYDGSSGSPVFLMQTHFASIQEGVVDVLAVPRIRLLGVLTGGEDHARPASLANVVPYTEAGPQGSVDVPLNVGYVVKGRCLLDFAEHLSLR